LIEQNEEEEKHSVKDLLEMAETFRFDFEHEEPIQLGEVEDKLKVLNELIRLRFDCSDEMQKGGIMQIKGVILGKYLMFDL
jgi:hypothetical protein